MTGYVVVPELRATPLDATGLPDGLLAESGDGRRWQVSRATLELLELLSACDSLEDAALRLEERWRVPVPVERLRAYIDRDLIRTGLVRPAGGEPPRPRRRTSALSLRFRVLPPAVVGVLAAPLTPLFAPAAFWPGFALAATAAIWAAALMTWNAPRLVADVVAPPVLGLFVLSTLLHELGHAAATRRGGGEPGEIGFGIYLFFPVLYTSVDACWRLPRQNRIIVDLGGVYLQLLMALILIAGGMLWPEFADTARAAFLAIAVSVIISAHPFLRLDGYWVIADAFGLVNLRRQSLEALRNAAARLRDPRAPRRPPSLAQADARVVAAVLGYGVLSILFFGYLALAIGRTYPAYATNVYPGLLRLELSRLAAGLAGFEPLTIFSALVNLAAPTALVVGVPLLLVRPAVRFLAGRNWRGRAASPAGRAPGGSR